VLDIVEACDAIALAVHDLKLDEYKTDRLIRSSVEREFITIGEAVAALPHLVAEVVNALRYSPLGSDALRTAAEGLLESGLALVGPDVELMTSAIVIALAHDLTIHDALFAALAADLGCELVTADRRQARVTQCPVRLLK
jgi:predicted nucleic acid-binding protein